MVDEKSDRPTALVTGANRGLGLETARQLQADGDRVVLTSRTESKGIAAARSLDADGKQVSYHQLDVTDQGRIAALAQDLPNLVPRLDVLVNNAGIGSWGGDRRLAAQTMAANDVGPRDATDALLPFIARGGRTGMVSTGLGPLDSLAEHLR